MKEMDSQSLSNSNFDDPAVRIFRKFFGGFDVLADRDTDILKRFFLGYSLRPAAGQAGTRNAVTFFGMAKYNPIRCHANHVTPAFRRVVR